MQIIDISQRVDANVVVWPGDHRFESRWVARIEDGASVNVGNVTMSTHTGTHADAPVHYDRDGKVLGELSLEAFVGPAVVVDVPTRGGIGPEHLDGVPVEEYPRVLFRTHDGGQPREWNDTFAYLLPETIAEAARRGCLLIGLDAPSVDPADSKALDAHHALNRHGVCNLENLVLAHVRPGRYFLSAAPVLLADLDAAPVRAVLIGGER